MPNPFRLYFTLLTLTVLLSACKGGNTAYHPGGDGTSATTGFTWISGSDMAEQVGMYGTQGTVDAANTPGARQYAATWTDNLGNFWLFGGYGLDSSGTTPGYLNDLWRFDGSNWTWISGSDTTNQAGNYGTQGNPATANIPGARSKAVTWVDGNGNLWLFGGIGYDSNGASAAVLNDLWRYNVVNKTWTWVAGSEVNSISGCYAISAGCSRLQPGSREQATAWSDSSGNYLWLFGGRGLDGSGNSGYLNDFWKFDVVNNLWTWTAGSSTRDQNGNYSAPAMPGGRAGATGWVDANGILWLFGGYGLDMNGTKGSLNDLWQYSTSWTWSGYGEQTVDAAGKYSSPTYVPGARSGATGWSDSDGNLWLFAGLGYDDGGNYGELDDVWMFDRITATGWHWITGDSGVDQAGVYGTQGTAAAGNLPGGREGASGWRAANGTPWLFGGYGWDGSGASGKLNDLWRYQP
jgi:hypothetical protein